MMGISCCKMRCLLWHMFSRCGYTAPLRRRKVHNFLGSRRSSGAACTFQKFLKCRSVLHSTGLHRTDSLKWLVRVPAKRASCAGRCFAFYFRALNQGSHRKESKLESTLPNMSMERKGRRTPDSKSISNGMQFGLESLSVCILCCNAIQTNQWIRGIWHTSFLRAYLIATYLHLALNLAAVLCAVAVHRRGACSFTRSKSESEMECYWNCRSVEWVISIIFNFKYGFFEDYCECINVPCHFPM